MNEKHNRFDDHSDEPPYSRLFIVCSKQHTEQHFEDAFSQFGTIEDIKLPKDRNTGESRGVAYIQFSKTSEAAAALEEMHYKNIANISRPIKVMVAASKSEIANTDEEKYRRLFIAVPKDFEEKDVRDEFEKYGPVESIIIQRDKNTGESKGLAYVKFKKFSSAALAFENVPSNYRAIFAEPKKSKQHSESSFESNINSITAQSTSNVVGLRSMMSSRPEGYTRLSVMCSPYLSQHQVARLFDIVPGMEHCQFMVDLMSECGKATIVYSNPTYAAYAREKLHNFEYPPGQRILVKPDISHPNNMFKPTNEVSGLLNNMKAAMNCGNGGPDIAQLVETIAQASSLIKAATTGLTTQPDSNDINYCTVKLPPPQPLADIDSDVVQRCFIVCRAQPPPLTILRDVFCRFGDLISVYTLPNKRVGFASYASARAAQQAMQVLHGAEICGVRLKVLEADEKPQRRNDNDNYNDNGDIDDRRKRVKIDNSD